MNANILSGLSVDQLKRALQLKEQISRLEKELESITGGRPAAMARSVIRPRPTISEAGRQRIVEAQRRRWARAKALQAAAQPTTTSTPGKRNLSPEARAKMSEASRARWARQREESK